MKVDFYVDVWPDNPRQALYATTTPSTKCAGCKRYKITANFPDSDFFGVIDGAAPVEEMIEVDKD